jgi:hypothetical protein
VQDEILKKYGKFIAYGLFLMGGPALALYVRFLMVEWDMDYMKKDLERERIILEDRLGKKITIINDHEQRLRVLECK